MDIDNQKTIKNFRQKGSVVIYTIFIMIAVMVISLSLMRVLLPKLKLTGESISSVIAFYAADSGMEWCLFSNRDDPAQSPIVPEQPLTLNYITGITIQYYSGNNPTTCPSGAAIDFRIVGTYRGISRSLEVF